MRKRGFDEHQLSSGTDSVVPMRLRWVIVPSLTPQIHRFTGGSPSLLVPPCEYDKGMSNPDNNFMDNPDLELAAESFDTDAMNLSGGLDIPAVIGEAEASDDLAE